MNGRPQEVGAAVHDRIFVRLLSLVAMAGGLALIIIGARLGAWPSVLSGGFFLTGGAYFHIVGFARRRPGRRVRTTTRSRRLGVSRDNHPSPSLSPRGERSE